VRKIYKQLQEEDVVLSRDLAFLQCLLIVLHVLRNHWMLSDTVGVVLSRPSWLHNVTEAFIQLAAASYVSIPYEQFAEKLPWQS